MSRPWMPLYVADYLRDTRQLTPAEHGAYLLLIMEYWTACGLPDDDGKLARIVGMSSSEWRKAKPTVQAFFTEGWKHGRIDVEIAKAEAKHERRSEAGKRGGIAKANAKQNPSNATSNAQASSSQPQSEREDSEAKASGADAPIDHRKRLFDEGLKKLATMTGKGPDACRSFVGKCLKASGDDAITVLGLIEDAERNQAVDPSAWIASRLKSPEYGNGKPRSAIIQAADDLCRKIASFDGPARGPDELRSREGPAALKMLSHR